jgi:hypothetical protein
MYLGLVTTLFNKPKTNIISRNFFYWGGGGGEVGHESCETAVCILVVKNYDMTFMTAKINVYYYSFI